MENPDGGGDGVDGAHAAATVLLQGLNIESDSERRESGSKERLLAELEKSARASGQWIDGNDNVSHEGRTLPGDAATEELQQTMAWKALVLAFRI